VTEDNAEAATRLEKKGPWLIACERWIDIVFPALARVALRRQVRGVLVLTLSTEEIDAALAAPSATPQSNPRHKGAWLSMRDFLDGFAQEPADIRAALEMMDPAADVAIFVRSSESADAFTRFLLMPARTKAVH
jgi:hypothetical protein